MLEFYHESVLIIVWNVLLTIILYTKENNYRTLGWITFFYVFAIFTKLTGVLLIIPIFFTLIYRKPRLIEGKRIEFFLIVFVISCVVINMNVTSPRELLYQYLYNVWHFKTDPLKQLDCIRQRKY